MPRKKSSKVRRMSSGKNPEAKKEASKSQDTKPSSSSVQENTPEREDEVPDTASDAEVSKSPPRRSHSPELVARPSGKSKESLTPLGRPFRMKLLPTACVKPGRYMVPTPNPEPEGGSGSASSDAVAGGSGLSAARGRRSSTHESVSGAGKRGRSLESSDRPSQAKRAHRTPERFAGHAKVRKFKRMRKMRRQKKRASIPKKQKAETSSSDMSSIDNGSGGNTADSSSSEPEPPQDSRGVKL